MGTVFPTETRPMLLGTCGSANTIRRCLPLPGALARCLSAIVLLVIAGCKPRLDSKSPTDRAQAVQGVNDQTVLAKIAIEDTDGDVRLAAVARLDDQRLLAKIVADSQDAWVRSKAVQKLTGQNVLADLAIKGASNDAIAKITDQSQLERVALNAGPGRADSAAVESLTDRLCLARVSIMAERSDVRRAAYQKLNPSEPLPDTANADRTTRQCAASLARFRPPASLWPRTIAIGSRAKCWDSWAC